jgi:hypothetical protein
MHHYCAKDKGYPYYGINKSINIVMLLTIPLGNLNILAIEVREESGRNKSK